MGFKKQVGPGDGIPSTHWATPQIILTHTVTPTLNQLLVLKECVGYTFRSPMLDRGLDVYVDL